MVLTTRLDFTAQIFKVSKLASGSRSSVCVCVRERWACAYSLVYSTGNLAEVGMKRHVFDGGLPPPLDRLVPRLQRHAVHTLAVWTMVTPGGAHSAKSAVTYPPTHS